MNRDLFNFNKVADLPKELQKSLVGGKAAGRRDEVAGIVAAFTHVMGAEYATIPQIFAVGIRAGYLDENLKNSTLKQTLERAVEHGVLTKVPRKGYTLSKDAELPVSSTNVLRSIAGMAGVTLGSDIVSDVASDPEQDAQRDLFDSVDEQVEEIIASADEVEVEVDYDLTDDAPVADLDDDPFAGFNEEFDE